MTTTYLNDPRIKRHWLERAADDLGPKAARNGFSVACPSAVIREAYGHRSALDAVENQIYAQLPEPERQL